MSPPWRLERAARCRVRISPALPYVQARALKRSVPHLGESTMTLCEPSQQPSGDASITLRVLSIAVFLTSVLSVVFVVV